MLTLAECCSDMVMLLPFTGVAPVRRTRAICGQEGFDLTPSLAKLGSRRPDCGGVDPGTAVGTPGVPVDPFDALGEESVAALPLARCVRCPLVIGGPGNLEQPAGRCHGRCSSCSASMKGYSFIGFPSRRRTRLASRCRAPHAGRGSSCAGPPAPPARRS